MISILLTYFPLGKFSEPILGRLVYFALKRAGSRRIDMGAPNRSDPSANQGTPPILPRSGTLENAAFAYGSPQIL